MKDAEELFQKWLDSKNLTRIEDRYYDVVNWDGAEPEERFYSEIKLKEAFIAGYNSDSWYYPSKGEYPKENESVCALVRGFDKPMIVHWCKDEKDEWCWQDCWDCCLYKADEVRCWQYVVSPLMENN